MTWRFAASASLAAIGLACSTAPEPTPILGPQPRTIAVVPILAPDFPQVLTEALDDSAHLSLLDRGYLVVPAAVTGTALASTGLGAGQALDSRALVMLRTEFGVDAVMMRTGRLREPVDTSREYLIEWALVDVIDGRTMWTRQEIGGPNRSMGLRLTGPTAVYADHPFSSDDLFLGRENENIGNQVKPATLAEQVDDVHARLSLSLPSYVEPDDPGSR